MSYNVTSWKVKKMDRLSIPLSAFFTHQRKDWHPGRVENEDGSLTLEGLEGCFVRGVVDGASIKVKEIECCGEGSGTFFSWILEPALKSSSGVLEATLVWEGGDTITRLLVRDGTLTNDDLDI